MLPGQDQRVRKQVKRHRQPPTLSPHHEFVFLEIRTPFIEDVHTISLVERGLNSVERHISSIMQRYRNWSGTSGIRFFEVGVDYIVLQWANGKPFTYTDKSIGQQNVEEMKRLAIKGSHLNKFINEHPEIRRGYVREKQDLLF
jgi:hypothetical protein